ncbi:MAG: hypothetical protein ACREL1_04420 [bacterium]
MRAKSGLAPWPELYSRAWKVCVELWPLWVARFLYLVVNYGTFLICLLLSCWPLVSEVMKDFQQGGQLSPSDYQTLMLEFMNRFKDFGFLGAVIGVFLLYMVWWTVISAWFNGGLYARLTAWVERDEVFSWSAFTREGFYHLTPMILLQALLGIALLLIVGSLLILGLFGGIALTFIHLPMIVKILFVIPLIVAGLAFLVFLLGYQAFCLVAQACLMECGNASAAFQKGLERCRANRWRAVWVLVIFILLVSVGLILMTFFLKALGMIPVVGILFTLASFVLRFFFYMTTDVFFPALAVVVNDEGKR